MAVNKSPNLGLAWGWKDGDDGWGGPVNYNWLIIDIVTNALALSATITEPPAGVKDGSIYIVPEDATGDWENRRGMVAARITGDWHYFQPYKGWYFRVEDTGLSLMYDGEKWGRYDGDKGDKGDRGDSIQLRRTDTEIQWRYPNESWLTLVPLADIKGETGDVTSEAISALNAAQSAAQTAVDKAEIATSAAESAEQSAEIAQKTVPVYSDTPPVDPIPGARWTDAETGRTFEWIVDQDSGQWVEIGAALAAGYDLVAAKEDAVSAASVAESARDDALNAAAEAIEAADRAESVVSGGVQSVNDIGPDAEGNVYLGVSNIPGLETTLNSKVDKQTGYGLSQENYTTSEKDKLAGIEAQATKNQSDDYLLDRSNHIGTQPASTLTGLAAVATSGSYNDLSDKPSIPTIPGNATPSQAGLMSSTDKAKLDGIAAEATKNASDAYLLNRANHTGTQAISTVTGLQDALDAKADASSLGDLATKDTVSITDIDATGTPSSTTYLRGDGTWETPAGGSAAQVGDIIQTVDFDRPDLAPPLWLPCNGSVYLNSAYPDLSELLAGTGPIAIVSALSDSGVPGGYFPVTMASNGNKIIIGYQQSNNYLTRVSTNGGSTWSELNVGGGLINIAHAGSGRWFAIVDSGDNFIGRASLTTNGSIWANNSLGLPSGYVPWQIVSDGLGNILVLGVDGVSVICTSSTNSGSSWASVILPEVESIDLFVASLGPQTFGVFFYTEEGLQAFITEDVGSSWFALNLPENHWIEGGARFYNAWVLLAATLTPPSYKILISRDKGFSWENLSQTLGIPSFEGCWSLGDLLVTHGSDGVSEGLLVLDQDRSVFTTPKISHGFVYTGVSS